MDIGQGGFLGFISDLAVALGEPTGSAGIRSQAKIAQQGSDAFFDASTKQQKAFQDIILAQDPKRQQDIFNLIKEMQKSQIQKSIGSNLLKSGSLRTATPYSIEALNQTLFKE